MPITEGQFIPSVFDVMYYPVRTHSYKDIRFCLILACFQLIYTVPIFMPYIIGQLIWPLYIAECVNIF